MIKIIFILYKGWFYRNYSNVTTNTYQNTLDQIEQSFLYKSKHL